MTFSVELDPNHLNIFVAYTKEKHIINYKGNEPLNSVIHGDLQFFRLTTSSRKNIAVVMEQAVFESIGGPLPNRENVVVSKTMKEQVGVTVKRSFEDAIAFCKENKYIIVIAGGDLVYRKALKCRNKLFATIIDERKISGDKLFPKHEVRLECVNEQVYPLIKGVEGVIYDGERFSENEETYSFFVGCN